MGRSTVVLEANRSESGKISPGCLITILVVVVVVGVGLFFLAKGALDIAEEMVTNEVRDNPVILEHIGNIQECDFDTSASGAAKGEDTMVFNLVGSKGKGQLTVIMNKDDDSKMVQAATLRTEDGETHELPMEED